MRGDRERFLVVLPVVLTASTAVAFWGASRWLGDDLGLLVGFGCYWAWCWAVPLAWWGPGGVRRLLAGGRPLFTRANGLLVAILAATVVGALWGYFLPGLARVSPWVMLFAPVAILNGTSEELLWRGVYVEAFGRRAFWAWVFPSFGFALSHLSPQLVAVAEGGLVPFLGSTLLLGLAYGWVAFRTGSARWTALAHGLIGLLAFGEPISTSLARLVVP